MNADSYGDALDCALKEITKLREQVKAQAAVIEKLREAMELIATGEEVNGCIPSLGWAVDIADEALAAPTDSTQILAEVRRAERERVAQYVQQGTGNWMLGKKIAEAIRAME